MYPFRSEPRLVGFSCVIALSCEPEFTDETDVQLGARALSSYRPPPSLFFAPPVCATFQGDTLLPGRHFEAAERFTPAKGPLAFIRLADGRGWVAVKKGEETFGQ